MVLFLIAAIAVPVIATLLYGAWVGNPLEEISDYTTPEWLTLAGTLLSYVGLCVSIVAVLKISQLTRQHFSKIRLPELKERAAGITGEMTLFASNTAKDLQTVGFVGSVPAFLRAVARVQDQDMGRLAKQARKQHKKLVHWAKKESNSNVILNEIPHYWVLFQSLNEIAEEINERQREVRAK